jgi:hypothetical protein
MHRNSPQMPGQALGEPLKKHARNPASLAILPVWKSCRFGNPAGLEILPVF